MGDECSEATSRAAEILSQIEPPEFPDREFDVMAYGAAGDGETDCTEAFEQAITACTESGGGRVVVPEGKFHTGAIHLQDDVNLHVSENATIRFSRNPEDYLPVVHTRYEGEEVMNYSPFVYAYNCENVAVTGSGTLDGRADPDNWWIWSGGEHPNEYDDKPKLSEMAEEGVPVEERIFGDGHFLRPNLLQPYRCENVLIEDITVTNSPMWHVHPVLCKNVTIRGLTVDTPRGSNTDGCNPESCQDVHVTGSYFDTGDDCLCFKAGKNTDGRRVNSPCENVLVEDCEMRAGNGGVVIGSENTGGVQNLVARNCRMSSPNLKRALRIKSNPDRGGYVRDIYFEDIWVGVASKSAIEIALDYAHVETGDHYPDVRDIDIRGLHVEKATRALYLVGNDENPISDVRLRDCIFEEMGGEDVIKNVEDISLENVEGVEVSNVN